MTDYTDLCAQGEAARWNLLYSSRDPETGDDLFPGTFVHLSVEDANGAAVTITALIAAIRHLLQANSDLEAQKRELALDVLAASGQAQEAYQAQLAAEATVATLTAQVEAMRGADAKQDAARFLYKHGDLTHIAAQRAIDLLSNNGFLIIPAALTTKEQTNG